MTFTTMMKQLLQFYKYNRDCVSSIHLFQLQQSSVDTLKVNLDKKKTGQIYKSHHFIYQTLERTHSVYHEWKAVITKLVQFQKQYTDEGQETHSTDLKLVAKGDFQDSGHFKVEVEKLGIT